ncbi:MFS transporter [Bifidobacterium thermophilum]|uniref:MFS transporter n=1 Tax=Bifidobacterium thermophilum TaxID=33905 RepID=UPI003F90AF31
MLASLPYMSIIGGVAPNFAILVVARVVQALGTGMIVPVGMNLTLAVAPKNKIGVYMGIIGAMTTLGPAFGPIVVIAPMAHGIRCFSHSPPCLRSAWCARSCGSVTSRS